VIFDPCTASAEESPNEPPSNCCAVDGSPIMTRAFFAINVVCHNLYDDLHRT
jgi:hypothetical protein